VHADRHGTCIDCNNSSVRGYFINFEFLNDLWCLKNNDKDFNTPGLIKSHHNPWPNHKIQITKMKHIKIIYFFQNNKNNKFVFITLRNILWDSKIHQLIKLNALVNRRSTMVDCKAKTIVPRRRQGLIMRIPQLLIFTLTFYLLKPSQLNYGFNYLQNYTNN
jgi:hypothetical protein